MCCIHHNNFRAQLKYSGQLPLATEYLNTTTVKIMSSSLHVCVHMNMCLWFVYMYIVHSCVSMCLSRFTKVDTKYIFTTAV